MAKKTGYIEPDGFFPKEIREKYGLGEFNVKNDVVSDIVDYIESLPEGTRISTIEILEKLFPEKISFADSAEIHFDIFDEVERRGSIILDMSEHEGKLEGVAQSLAYTIRKNI